MEIKLCFKAVCYCRVLNVHIMRDSFFVVAESESESDSGVVLSHLIVRVGLHKSTILRLGSSTAR